MNPEECIERIGLIEKYSRSVNEYSVRREALNRSTGERKEADWEAAESALEESHKAWQALEQHIAEHRCLDLGWTSRNPADTGASQILGQAAAAALDAILIADDDRCYVDLNEAAADILGLPRSEIVGRRIDEFFSEASGQSIPAAWESFVSDGVKCGICELKSPGQVRRFEYRAKANFAPGLHLSVLREQLPDANHKIQPSPRAQARSGALSK